ncbi:hypothetical protein LEP1GSC168_1481 [Leptospira santarosai str. HAI134]|nr:hypothetical protein LEP1GSC169_3497 [Leptospira santarosai str. HAI1349]EMO21645.1 hypothetical protein LEP1GSC168_1481 [Leptospira santarosai str. HAI134]EMP80733.1 hypothetical protein LEP1GSC162_2957 [Leptospira santarosai str. CBC1531]
MRNKKTVKKKCSKLRKNKTYQINIILKRSIGGADLVYLSIKPNET